MVKAQSAPEASYSEHENVRETAKLFLEFAKYFITQFNQRRTFEWQFCIAIWTALAALTGVIATAEKPPPHFTWIFLILFGGLLLYLQLRLYRWLTPSNHYDM